MKSNSKLIIGIVALLCLALIIGLFLFNGKKQKQDVVKIGVVGPLTGTGATTSAYWVNGLNFAVENLNAIEGGEKYELLVEDCQSDPSLVASCYKRLELQGVKYFIAVGGQFAMVAAPLTKGKDVLYFTTADYNEAILDQTDRGFRVSPTAATFADTAIHYINRNYGYSNYGTFALNTVACLDATRAFVRGVESINGNVVFQETYDMGANDFNSVVSKVANKHADCIFMTGFGISPLAFTNQLAANSSFDSVVLFGDHNVATKSFVDGLRNNKATIYSADCRFSNNMEKEYIAKYGSRSNVIATGSYIIPFLIKSAREKASFDDINSQLNYLRGNIHNTAIGDVKIDEKGNCEMAMEVYKIQ